MAIGVARRIVIAFVSGLLLVAPAAAQQPAASGTVAGQVIDAKTGDPLIDAGVEIVGAGRTVRTDLDGRFSVKVPAGTYAVRFFAPAYQSSRIERVVVEPGKVATADVPLKPEGSEAVQVVEVVAQAAKAAEATQIVKRQRASVVSDNIGAETIKKAPDSDAAEIVQRVPAVTIKDDKFIFVRGLGERYSQALLNGSRLPSPDPERRVVPLDLFPAEFLESISIIKSYTPDLPGDFSGGLADIELLDFPLQLTMSGGLTLKGNSQTTAQGYDTYKGSGKDRFGFGGDFRALPDVIPDRSIAGDAASRRTVFGRAFRDIWDVDTQTAPPDFDVNFQIADRWGPVGARLAVTFSNETRTRTERVRQFLQGGSFEEPNPIVGDDFSFEHSTFSTRLGAVFTSAYEISPNHRLTFRSLLDRNADDTVLVGRGTTEQTGVPQVVTDFRYEQDQLGYGQLGGNHHFQWLDVDWRSALAQTTQNVPDERITNRVQSGNGFNYSTDAFGGSRIFQDLTENLTDSQVDFSIPLKNVVGFLDDAEHLPGKIKFGPAYAYRKRDSELRIFQHLIRADNGDFDFTQPVEDLLAPENIGGGQPPFPFNFTEITNPQNAFEASQEIAAFYGMAELPIIPERLRFIGGVRTEYSYIQLDIKDQNGVPLKIIKNDLDPLPSASLVYTPRPDMNVRAGYSQTVSRPEFRELSPVVYPAARGLRGQVGNPFLEETSIDSWDLRWEWFFAPTELVSASFFYKDIPRPIEQAVFISGSAPQDTFQQNKDATLWGFEFEGRKNLGFLTPRLQYLNFFTNVTYVHSEVTAEVRPGTETEPAVTRKRKLQGQSPYVVNAGIEYAHPEWGTARLLYNTVGPTISHVQDRTALPDFIQERRDQLDFVYLNKVTPFGIPLNIKLAVENILNDDYPTTVGDTIQENYKTGVTVSLGLSYTY
jgi:outer membrane receptor protein involved in Fe transport